MIIVRGLANSGLKQIDNDARLARLHADIDGNFAESEETLSQKMGQQGFLANVKGIVARLTNSFVMKSGVLSRVMAGALAARGPMPAPVG